jgi:peptidoglycan/LPS O-acetylase OafA/YrhL
MQPARLSRPQGPGALHDRDLNPVAARRRGRIWAGWAVNSLNSSYIPGVDHLRAFAAALVLLQHSYEFIGLRLSEGDGGESFHLVAGTPFEAVVIDGHTGVALFMVLSGFIFTNIGYGKKIRYGSFMLNRILRIYPLMIAIFAAGFLVKYPEVSPLSFLSVLAIPFQLVYPVDLWFVPSVYPFTTLFWTIAPEFQFYLLFPLILALIHRRGPAVLAVLLAGALLLRVLLVANGAPAQSLSYWTIFGRIDQFLIGMGAAIAYRFIPVRYPGALCVAVAVIMPFVLFAFNHTGDLDNEADWKVLWPTAEAAIWACFIVGYLHLAGRLPALLSKVLAAIGEVSFSMYLLHVAVIAAVMKLGPITFGLGPSGAALANAVLLVLPLTIAVSFVTFRVIERPFLKMRVRYLEPFPETGAPAEAVAAGTVRR